MLDLATLTEYREDLLGEIAVIEAELAPGEDACPLTTECKAENEAYLLRMRADLIELEKKIAGNVK